MLRDTIRVGLILGWKQIRRANIWTTSLIVFIMMLTFLNLVVVSGILVGLIEGSVRAYRNQYSGDIIITTPTGEEYIEKSSTVLRTLDTIPGVREYSARAVEGVSVEANYRIRRDPQEVRDTVATRVVGINPISEDSVTNIAHYIVEGEYLDSSDEGFVLLGSNMLKQYAPDFGDIFPTLDNVHPGSRIRLTVGNRTKEFIVKGILKSKVDETSFRAFMLENDFNRFVGRTSLNVNEVAVVVEDGVDPAKVKQAIIASGVDGYAVVRLSREALPKALEDIMITFDLLGNAISSIGLVVSSITMFIVIFVNAITRRKYIGILKGIGIRAGAIELSYVVQSLLYAVVGAGIGMFITYVFLVPLFDAHPINFPFSDGILVAPLSGTLIRLTILLISTVVAGYIPAWMIIKRNTLDSILGR
ncbi:MAG: ABC transporter permease [Patescibacteria group bacterium]